MSPCSGGGDAIMHYASLYLWLSTESLILKALAPNGKSSLRYIVTIDGFISAAILMTDSLPAGTG